MAWQLLAAGVLPSGCPPARARAPPGAPRASWGSQPRPQRRTWYGPRPPLRRPQRRAALSPSASFSVDESNGRDSLRLLSTCSADSLPSPLSAPTAAVSPCPPDTQASFRSRVASPPTHRERREGGNHSSGAKVVEHAGGVGSAQHLPAALPPGQVAITAAGAALAASDEALGLPAGTARAAALEQALLTVGKARALSGEVRTKYRSTVPHTTKHHPY